MKVFYDSTILLLGIYLIEILIQFCMEETQRSIESLWWGAGNSPESIIGGVDK
jgi:hypothetical protein